MRISHVVPYRLDPYSGVYTAIANITASLAQLGHDVQVWELSPWPRDAAELAELVDAAGARRRSLPTSPRPWTLATGAKRLIDAEMNADIVHLHSAFSPQNNLLARTTQAPLVLSPHGVFAAESLAHGKLKKRIFRRLFELPTLATIQAVCALTEEEKQEAVEFGFTGRIEVIPNGVALPQPGLAQAAIRAELAVPAGDRLALFVGRIDLHHKRIDRVAQVIAATPGWHLAIVGPDYRGDEERLRHLVASLEGWERIHLLGPRRGAALAEAFAGADVFMLLSRHEGMPMSLLEALAHGLPAVVSPEVEATLPVAGSGAGWVTDFGGLSSLLRSLGGHENMQAASDGARRLAAGYRWESIAAQYVDLYADLAATR